MGAGVGAGGAAAGAGGAVNTTTRSTCANILVKIKKRNLLLHCTRY